MTVYKLPEMTETAVPDRPLSVALGNFDGVHTGHRRLLSAAVEAAKQTGDCVPAVWTFHSLVKEGPPIPCLTDRQEKLRQFAAAGIRYAIFEDFDAVRHMKPMEFVSDYLLRKLGCAAAVCGFNFRFGYGGAGDADQLRELLSAARVPVTVIPPVMNGTGIVSSTRIRRAVAEGDMDTARVLLGRYFSICFPVLHGKELGRTIGLPTINQDFPEGHIIPRGGIYACICHVGDRRYAGVSNVGMRPSVPGDGHVNCETHIIDYSGILYGKSIRVEFCCRLRDEKKFDSIEELRQAIEDDVCRTRAYFAEIPIG
ncbi:MAG: riboflavin biosynthesis protein RibF [Clostridia bacterium]|nr:riboflavin biosynthesis protein RibF [Clostridia bacterium]